MEIDEVKEQTKNWLDSRLKNPYFGAVIAVWIITNRVLVFSLFNFDETTKLVDRINYIHNQLQEFNKWGLTGFWGTIIWSFGWGFVAMIILDIVNGAGKSLFKLVRRITNWMLSKVEPSKWKEIEEFYTLEKKNNDLDTELKNKKIEVKRLEKDYDDAIVSLNQAVKDKADKEKQIEANSKTLLLFEEQARQQTEEKNRFKIIYAKYGTDDVFIEVTKAVSDLLSTSGKFNANNETLKFDPSRYSIKKLTIDYQFNAEQKSLQVNEEDTVELQNGLLTASESEKSSALKRWSQNLVSFSELMNGTWRFTNSKNGKGKTETVTVDKAGKYLVDGKHKYDLLVSDFSRNQIVLNKIELEGRVRESTERLNKINERLISGTDNNGNTVEYTKL